MREGMRRRREKKGEEQKRKGGNGEGRGERVENGCHRSPLCFSFSTVTLQASISLEKKLP